MNGLCDLCADRPRTQGAICTTCAEEISAARRREWDEPGDAA